MEKMNKHKIYKLLETENRQLQKLNELVIKSIEEERLISDRQFELEEKDLDLGSRMADKIASFGGSWTFILLFALLTCLWVVANVYFLSRPFDPYPFILLNLLFSTLAALQAPVIMMSQNRKEAKDRQRGINDYMVNVKAEIEVRNLQQKLDFLIQEQMKTLFEVQKLQMEMIEEIKESLTKVKLHG